MAADYLRIFWRAFAIVLPTGANVSFIAQQRWGWVFACGFAISGLWWHNARVAARSDLPGAWLAYALGAAVASVLGAWLARLV